MPLLGHCSSLHTKQYRVLGKGPYARRHSANRYIQITNTQLFPWSIPSGFSSLFILLKIYRIFHVLGSIHITHSLLRRNDLWLSVSMPSQNAVTCISWLSYFPTTISLKSQVTFPPRFLLVKSRYRFRDQLLRKKLRDISVPTWQWNRI